MSILRLSVHGLDGKESVVYQWDLLTNIRVCKDYIRIVINMQEVYEIPAIVVEPLLIYQSRNNYVRSKISLAELLFRYTESKVQFYNVLF